MRQFMILRLAAREETVLAHVEIEAFQASVSETFRSPRVSSRADLEYRRPLKIRVSPEPSDGVLLAYVTFRLMLGALRGGESMKHRQPDHALRLLLQPAQKVHRLYLVLVLPGLLEAATHAGLDVRPAECRHFPELPRHLDAVVQQQAQFPLIHQSVRIGDQSEQI